MTRKDFKALAAIVYQADTITNKLGREWLAVKLADYCAERNPRFDRSRFLIACGIEVR